MKVSILMPACNVEKYLKECMDSIVNQTLKEIEIICIDDGSKDLTGDILDEYSKKDSRIKVVHKENTGYGHSMNLALSMATGEYVGIIETDDYAELNMFEELYNTAKKYDADVVKSTYYRYATIPEVRNRQVMNLDKLGLYDEVFSPKDQLAAFKVSPSLWTGIYRREMLRENDVRFNETPGASYQDTAFAFKVWCSAERVVFVRDAFLHYRIDNENSSVNSPKKIYCLCDEYEEMNRYLEEHPGKRNDYEEIKNYLVFAFYNWNLRRLAVEYKYVFLEKMAFDLKEIDNRDGFNKNLFLEEEWEDLQLILHDTDVFFDKERKRSLKGFNTVNDLKNEYVKLKADSKKLQRIRQSKSYKIGRVVTFLPRKMRRKS